MTVRQKTVAKAAGGGALRSGVGAFAVAVLVEIGLIPEVGPNTLILLTWAAGQIVYTALQPRQWRALLGQE